MRDPAEQLRDYAHSIDAAAPSFDAAGLRARPATSIAEPEPLARVAPRRSSRPLVAAAAVVVLIVGAAVLVARRSSDESTVAVVPEPPEQGWTELAPFVPDPAAGEHRSWSQVEPVWTGEELLFVGALQAEGLGDPSQGSIPSGPESGADPAAPFVSDIGRIPALDPATGVWRTIEGPPVAISPSAFVAAWTGQDLVVVGKGGDAGTELRAAAYRPGAGWRSIAAPPTVPQLAALPISSGNVVWAGDRLVLAVGNGILTYRPGDDSWTAPLDVEVPAVLDGLVWDGRTVLVFYADGGQERTLVRALDPDTGALPGPDTWTGPRGQAVTWTGSVFGASSIERDPDGAAVSLLEWSDDGWNWRGEQSVEVRLAFGPRAVVWRGSEVALLGGFGADGDAAVDGVVVDTAAPGVRRDLPRLPVGSIPISDGLIAGDRIVGWGITWGANRTANPEPDAAVLRVVSIPLDEVFVAPGTADGGD